MLVDLLALVLCSRHPFGGRGQAAVLSLGGAGKEKFSFCEKFSLRVPQGARFAASVMSRTVDGNRVPLVPGFPKVAPCAGGSA